MTFQELKRVTNERREEKVPTAKYLRTYGEEIAAEKMGDAQVTAYRDGHAMYCVGRRSTVFSIHKCGDYCYERLSGRICIDGEYFEHQEWYLRLILEGEDRLYGNREAREKEMCVSYDRFPGEPAGTDKVPTPLEHIIMKENIQELLGTLTARQRQVVGQLICLQKKEKEVAAIFGIAVSTVSGILSRARLRMRKQYETYRKRSR